MSKKSKTKTAARPTHSIDFKAETDGVLKMMPSSCHSIIYTVKCTQCGCERNDVRILDEDQDVDGSRGTANFVMNCKDCQRQCKISYTSQSLENEMSEDWMTLVTFDCRGCSIEKAECDDWQIISESENTYEWNGTDEFFEYDEDLEKPVTVANMEFRVQPV